MLMTGLEPLERGGEARLPRPVGNDPSSGWCLGPGHPLPPTEIGDKGALRPPALMIGGTRFPVGRRDSTGRLSE